jgi:uncharacterized protein
MPLIWLFPFLLYVVEIVGTLGGFGSSMLLIPLAGIFLPFHEVLLITALLHVVSNVFKIMLFREGLNRSLLMNMGIPSIAGVLLGAWLSGWVTDQLAGLLVGSFLTGFSIWMLMHQQWKLSAGLRNAAITGSLAGFTAGLLGTGGAIRGMGLAAFDLSKQVFIATSAAIDLGVDSSRLLVYWSKTDMPNNFWLVFPGLLVASWTGTWTGKRILEKVPQERFRQLVLLLVLAIGIFTLSRAIYLNQA